MDDSDTYGRLSATKGLTNKVQKCATEMKDGKLLTKPLGCDMVAIDANTIVIA